MALRNIRVIGEDILSKRSKEVTEMTPRIKELIEDMFDTLHDAQGVGLAAPQVGILKRIVVLDIDGTNPMILINPRIIESSGEQSDKEACLSVPGKSGYVKRPTNVKVEAQDLLMNPIQIEAQDLLARAICHEVDHLDGLLYVSKVDGELMDNPSEEQEEDAEDGSTESVKDNS
ncbi:MAG: peptide deformylase [Clostridium sp.]|nr:peptide deformylase [Clostridium sp.]